MDSLPSAPSGIVYRPETVDEYYRLKDLQTQLSYAVFLKTGRDPGNLFTLLTPEGEPG